MDASRRLFLRARGARDHDASAASGGPAASRAGTPAPDAPPRITEACLARQRIECRVCGERCDEGAIRFRPTLGGVALPDLLAERCTACGECLAVCPSGALQRA